MFEGYDWWTFVSIETVDWPHNSSGWQAWLARSLNAGGKLHHEGSKFDDTTRPFLQQRAVGSSAHLLVAPLVDGNIAVYVAGVGAATQETDEAIEAWTEAVQKATASLGDPGDVFEWSAVIGPPSPRISGAEPTVGAPVLIGPLQLRRSENSFFEAWASSTHPGLNNASYGESWPIMVEGRSTGVDWPAASQRGARDLHRLTNLLTLAWQQPLVVRDALAPLAWGVRTVPEQPFWQTFDHVQRTSSSPKEEPLPEWFGVGWDRLAGVRSLERAAAAYHQGLLMHQEHPSLALVAFIASIEAVGSLMFKEKRCKGCGSTMAVGKAFRDTLAVVLDAQEAEDLGRAYSARSRTVHQGSLHGSEGLRGAMPTFDPWQIDTSVQFDWGVTWPMQKAARELIVRGLRDELPARE